MFLENVGWIVEAGEFQINLGQKKKGFARSKLMT
jgi:hypothetical protein